MEAISTAAPLFRVTPGPDLELLVRRIAPRVRTLTFEIKANALGINYQRFGQIDLRLDPLLYLSEFLSRIDPDQVHRERHLQSAGSFMIRELMPRELQQKLWELQGEVSTIQIQCDEPGIPWELLRLERRRRGRRAEYGPFLCEAFDLTHWRYGLDVPQCLQHPPSLEVRSMAVIAPRERAVELADREVEKLLGLNDAGFRVERIEAEYDAILDAFASGNYDVLHFTGHGSAFSGEVPDSSKILCDGYDTLTPFDLAGEASHLGVRAPLVFFNACYSGRGGFSLTAEGGWAARFLQAGAGAFIGTHWSIGDAKALEFCAEFYDRFLAGETLAAALGAARRRIRQEGDPTWLAYTAFAHPLLTRRRARARPEGSEAACEERPRDQHRQHTEPLALRSESPAPKPVTAPEPSPPRQVRSAPKPPAPESPAPQPSTPKPSAPKPSALKHNKPSPPQTPVPKERVVERPALPTTHLHAKSGILFLHVPGGRYILGAEDLGAFSSPKHEVWLSPFWIAKHPVTNSQYQRFLVEDTGHGEPKYWHNPRFNAPEQPVVGVSWDDAQAYCRWAGLVLPSEAQWEAAARGFEGRRYPWGDVPPNPRFACFAPAARHPAMVEDCPEGEGPYGTLGQAGNVWEWCMDAWDAKAYLGRHLSQDPVVQRADKMRVVRGGSWMGYVEELLAAHRERLPAGTRFSNQGFRCVSEVCKTAGKTAQ